MATSFARRSASQRARAATRGWQRTMNGAWPTAPRSWTRSAIVHFYAIDKARLLVLDIDLEASVCPITFGDTKEGSMGYRINDQIATNPDKSVSKEIKGKGMGKLENSLGKIGEKDCWGHLAAWTDYSGTIDGKAAGLAYSTIRRIRTPPAGTSAATG